MGASDPKLPPNPEPPAIANGPYVYYEEPTTSTGGSSDSLAESQKLWEVVQEAVKKQVQEKTA